MSTYDSNRERGFQLFGWLLFLVCAGLFIASSVESGSILDLAASIIFLVGSIVFIIPLLIKGNRN